MAKRRIFTFSFDRTQIRDNSSDLQTWHGFVRREEFRMIMSVLGNIRFRHALELGAGDGGQSQSIAQFCEHLTCTELDENGNVLIGKFNNRGLHNVVYQLCDATDLSRFPDKTFDFIFSSNMLEHIPRWDLCLAECGRVLEDDGVMIHIMPSQEWKLWNFLVYLVYNYTTPPIHGASSSHFSEFINFGEGQWIRKIERAGMRVDALLRMPFYHGNGPTAIPLLILGNNLGWKSSTAFLLRKKAANNRWQGL